MYYIIGGMDRLKPDYMETCREAGHEVNGARDKAILVAKRKGIHFEMFHCCGESSLKEFLRQRFRKKFLSNN